MVLAVVSTLSLNGCTALAIAVVGAVVGIAGETAIGYSISGVASRTLTAPFYKVRSAALTAMKRMGIKIEERKKTKRGEIIKANTKDRKIEVRLEIVSGDSTLVRTKARYGFFFHDRATATEIIKQTESVLNGRSSKS